MSTERDLLDTIVAAQEDDGPREVYADWLDEQGRVELAAQIRAGLALARAEQSPEPSWDSYAPWARAANALDRALAAELNTHGPRIDLLDGRLQVRRGLPELLTWRSWGFPGGDVIARLGTTLAALRTIELHPTQHLLDDVARVWPRLEGIGLSDVGCYPRERRLATPLVGLERGRQHFPDKQTAWLRAHADTLRRVSLVPGRRASSLDVLHELPALDQLSVWSERNYRPHADWRVPSRLRELRLFGADPRPAWLDGATGLRRLHVSAPALTRALTDAIARLPLRHLTLAPRHVAPEAIPRLAAQSAPCRGLDLLTIGRDASVPAIVEHLRPTAMLAEAGALDACDRGLDELRWLQLYGWDASLTRRLLELPLVHLAIQTDGPGLDLETVERLALHPTLHALFVDHTWSELVPWADRWPPSISLRDDLYLASNSHEPVTLPEPRCSPFGSDVA